MLIYLYDKRNLINVHSENCTKKVKRLNFFSTTLMQYRNAEFYLSINKNRNEHAHKFLPLLLVRQYINLLFITTFLFNVILSVIQSREMEILTIQLLLSLS